MKRLGKVSVTRDLLQDEPERVAEIFHFMKFAPFDIEYALRCDYYVYTGVCHLFEPLMEGVIIPEYVLSVHMNRSDGKGFIDGVNVKQLTEVARLNVKEMFNESQGKKKN